MRSWPKNLVDRAIIATAMTVAMAGTLILLYYERVAYLPVLYLFTSLFFLGLLVWLRDPTSETNISFSVLCLGIALWSYAAFRVTNRVVTGLSFWDKFVFAPAAITLAAIVYFTLVFPRGRPGLGLGRRLAWLIPLPFILALLPMDLVIKDVVIRGGVISPVFGPAYPIYAVFIISYLGCGLFNLLRNYFISQGVEKLQIKYVLFGISLFFVAVVISNLILPWVGLAQLAPYGPFFSLFFVGFTSYAIVKHRLMSIEIILQKSLAYILVSTLVLMIYGLAVWAAQTFLGRVLGYRSLIIIGVVALFVAVIYQPLARWLIQVSAALFFGSKYDYQQTLRKVSQAIATKIKMEELTRLIVATLVETMGISEISFLINDRERGRFRSVPVELTHAGASRYKRIELDAASSIIKWLKENQDILVLDEIKSQNEVAEEMERLGVTILVPIISQEELIGTISLGNKLSGDIFSSEDIGLLQTLANQTAVALLNARLFEEVVGMKEYNEEILNSMVSGVLTCDSRGKIITFNPMAEKITGYRASEVISRTFSEAFPQKSALSGALENTLKGRNLRNLEMAIVSPERGLVPVSLSTTTLHDLRGKKSGALLLIIDLTEVKELENKVRRADKLGALGTMAAGMAHEIKNPLSSMKVLSQLLPIKYQDEEFRNKFIEIMPREISRIDRIVESLLGFARATSPKFSRLDLKMVLEEDLKYYEDQAKKSGVEIVREFQNVPEIEADPDQLPQVFSNLILNAIQAMPEGGRLVVALREGKKIENVVQSVQIEVSDTGHGINPTNLARLFDPFFTTKYAGTGLGLTIAHSIVDGHRGSIDVKSEIGKGTAFIVTLPLSQELV